MPSSLAGVLANIPGLAGYEAGRQEDQSLQLGQLQQVGALQGIIAKSIEQRQAQAYRDALSGLGPNPTTDQLGQVAARFGGPKEIMAHADRVAQQSAMREMTMARLQQAAMNFQATYALRYGAAKTNEEKLALQQQKATFEQQLQSEAARLAGARANYDFGFTPNAPPAATVAPATGATAAPSQQGAQQWTPPPVGTPQPVLDAAAAIRANLAAGGQGGTVAMPEGTPQVPGPSVPTGAALAAPVAAPSGPAMPAAPNNLDARDLGAGTRGPVIPAPAQVATAQQAAITPSTTPGKPTEVPELPPEIARLPRKQQDAWLVQNAGGGIDQTAKGISEYKIAPLSSFAMARPLGAKVMGRVMELNPNYDAKFFPVAIANEKSFTSGRQGDQIRSFNVAINHLNTLKELTVALQNNDVQRVNQFAQRFAQETGQPAPNNFDAAKTIVGDEITKAIIGAKGALGDREQTAQAISRMNSPQQLNGVIDTFLKLMGGQLNGLEKQYEAGTRRKDFRERFLTPEALSSAAVASTAPGGAPSTGGPKEGETGTSKSGKATIFRNGRWEYQ